MKCKARKGQGTNPKWTSDLDIPAALLLIVLPKCSFCILAYSSALVMCSGNQVMGANTTGIIIMAILSATILYGVLKNFRVDRSYSALVVVGGALVILWIAALGDLPTIYHLLGSGFLFFGIWINGSFLSFRNQLKKILTMKQTLKSDL